MGAICRLHLHLYAGILAGCQLMVLVSSPSFLPRVSPLKSSLC